MTNLKCGVSSNSQKEVLSIPVIQKYGFLLKNVGDVMNQKQLNVCYPNMVDITSFQKLKKKTHSQCVLLNCFQMWENLYNLDKNLKQESGLPSDYKFSAQEGSRDK